jgi:CubicO group peptidase (beta-lactamase class C family)
MFLSRLSALAAIVTLALAGSAAAAPPADLKARADAILQASYPADAPGAAVIITRGGQTIYAAGRGLADVDARRPITPDTIFRLGSITKQFTAATILQLVQEGKVSLDDPVSRFLPDFPQPGASATVRQLLNHTSGIVSYTGIPGWMVEANTSRPHSTAQMIALFKDLPAVSKPGEQWAYNNSGYVLLGAIIEAATGKPWYQAVDDRIAAPLRLRTIGYGVDRESAPAMARGYTGGTGQVKPAQSIHMSVPHGAGALVGTVRDLATWAHALHHGRVLNPASYAAMTAPTALPDGRSEPYGFGLGMGAVRGRPALGHSGGIFGFSTDSLYVPADDLFVAVFANSDDPATSPALLSARLAALALGDPYRTFQRMEVDQAKLAPLFGVYRIGDTGVSRRFFARDGKLYTMREGAPESEVLAGGGDHFFYPTNNNWFRIVRRPGSAPVMEMHQNGDDKAELATRTGDLPAEAAPAQVARALLQSYAGRYQTAGPAVDITLTDAGTLTIQLTGQPALPLRAASDTDFMVQGVDARIVFHTENGQVTRLVIHQAGQQLEARRAPD